jgi:hypothetical protein
VDISRIKIFLLLLTFPLSVKSYVTIRKHNLDLQEAHFFVRISAVNGKPLYKPGIPGLTIILVNDSSGKEILLAGGGFKDHEEALLLKEKVEKFWPGASVVRLLPPEPESKQGAAPPGVQAGKKVPGIRQKEEIRPSPAPLPFSFLSWLKRATANPVILIIWIIVGGFVLLFLFFLIMLLGSRLYKILKEEKVAAIRGRYERILAELIFSGPDQEVNTELLRQKFDGGELEKKLGRTLLQRELIKLRRNFSGEVAGKVKDIYLLLGFDKLSNAKLRSRRWYLIAEGIIEISEMDMRDYYNEVAAFTNHRNFIVRSEAQIATVKLGESDYLRFLDDLSYPLTEWQQLKLHSILSGLSIEKVPDFRNWLGSSNTSVVLFCISMIAHFRQMAAIDDLIKLIDTGNEKVKASAVFALKELSAFDAIPVIASRLEKLGKAPLLNAVDLLSSLGDPEHCSLLEDLLNTGDYDISLKACRGIKALTPQGRQRLISLREGSSPELIRIIDHALDERI